MKPFKIPIGPILALLFVFIFAVPTHADTKTDKEMERIKAEIAPYIQQ